MTTAVVSPTSFQPLPRLGWNNNSGGAGGLNSMSADEVSRMFMPQRKSVQRTNSSSSISSASSSSTTISPSQQPSPSSVTNGESGHWSSKKKPKGGFWPASKAEPVSGLTTTRPQVSTTTSGPNAVAAMSAVHQPSPIVPSQQNGVRNTEPPAQNNETLALLALSPLNGTFESKQINVPFQPGILKVGRQTNAKTVPTSVNGYFDSKVLSRAHAEVWADRDGKIWIRDVKSSNGTFVNGQRLSPENRDSEPHELREHDTLELGIDIVSEDQKSIVHHKVSAKVEFAGIPGNSNNVLDLDFGDIDPSQGGGLLSSPITQPAAHSRGRPVAPYNRSAASSVSAGSQTSALSQQRQMNMWSMPLSVEHLVKMLSNEMKTAKQQAEDLDQTNNFLNSLLSTDHKDEKTTPAQESSSGRLVNGKPKLPKIDPASRFSDPPAPPPQQPLPETPDMARSSPSDSCSVSSLKRGETTRSLPGTGGSPTDQQSSQMLSLVEALSSARKELDSQGARVKCLEDMLRQERSARECAEERARRLEQSASFKPVQTPEQPITESNGSGSATRDALTEHQLAGSSEEMIAEGEVLFEEAALSEDNLQSKLDEMVAEMDRMKRDMQRFQQRAETAEANAATAKASLAEMIERLRQESEESAHAAEQEVLTSVPSVQASRRPENSMVGEANPSLLKTMSRPRSNIPNGHIKTSSRLPENVERAVAHLLRTGPDGQLLAQSAPYASMLGVVLIGVGLMACLNSWPKIDQ